MPDRAEKLAASLLKEYGHLLTFDVDPGDPQAAALLQKALEAHGCTVVRKQFSTQLHVSCPKPDEMDDADAGIGA